jgi:hypothetical protein
MSRAQLDLLMPRWKRPSVLAVEVVPLYRNIAQGELEQLDSWQGPKKAPRKATTKKARGKTTTKATPRNATAKNTPNKPPSRKP